MTTPSSTISMSDVNTELGQFSSATISLNDSNVRTLAGVPLGSISMSDLRGKSSTKYIDYHISTNTAQAYINVTQLSGYVAGKSVISIYVDSGVNVYSNDTGTPALTITGSLTSGDSVTLYNNGYIVGRGGTGGTGGKSGIFAGTAGGNGGSAISAGCEFSITNNGIIGGGGGGGAGGTSASSGSGGGGGGGAGFGSGGPAGTASSRVGSAGSNGANTVAGGGGAGGGNSYAGRDGGGLGSYGGTMPSVTVPFFSLMVTVPSVPGGAPGTSIIRNGYSIPVSGSGSVYN